MHTRRPIRTTLVCAGIIGATALGAGACSFDKATQPFQDAGRTPNKDSGPATVVEMPDGFNNVATKCIAGTDVRVTVTYHGDSTYGSISTVVDPSCGAKLFAPPTPVSTP